MRILVTGGSGVLGQALSGRLADAGLDFTLLDKRPAQSGLPTRVVDVLDAQALAREVRGHDVVVHAAALHGIHVGVAPDCDFMSVNCLGTLNVLNAALQAGVEKLVFISSTSVYGIDKTDLSTPAAYLDETTPVKPRDMNDLCKVVGEHLCDYLGRLNGLRCVSLRCGRFFRDNWVDFNLRLFAGGVDVEDVAEAVLRTTAAPAPSDVYCIAAPTLFQREDAARLKSDARGVLEERYPGAPELLDHFEIPLPASIDRIVDVTRARTELGFEAGRTAETFLEELVERRHDEQHSQSRAAPWLVPARATAGAGR